MKQEYKEKLEFVKKKLIADDSLSFEEQDERFNSAFDTLEELVNSKDTEVLCELINFFTPENEEYGGFGESLEVWIQCNFTSDQIIEAFYKKFDSFMEKNSMRCMKISMRFFDEGNETDFLKFRAFFNFVKSKHAKELLDIFKEWFKYGWSEKSKNYVYALENDMKKWKDPQKKII